MKARTKRLCMTALALLSLGAAGALTVNRLRSAAVFYYTPSEAAAAASDVRARTMRVGGLIQKGSLVSEGLDVSFTITDGAQDLQVRYHGLLPALFREGQGTVATGSFKGEGLFVADSLLAKHDENYMPPEASAVMKGAQGKMKYAKPAYGGGAQ